MKRWLPILLVLVFAAGASGCATSLVNIPIEITSDPPGAEIRTIPNNCESSFFLWYTKSEGCAGSCWCTSPAVNSFVVGKTPYRTTLQYGDRTGRWWLLPANPEAHDLIHSGSGSVYPFPVLVNVGWANVFLQCQLSATNCQTKVVKEKIMSGRSIFALFIPGGAVNARATKNAMLTLKSTGIKRHFVLDPVSTSEPSKTGLVLPVPQQVAAPLESGKQPSADQQTAGQRLKELKELKDKGILTDEEYETKRKALVKEL